MDEGLRLLTRKRFFFVELLLACNSTLTSRLAGGGGRPGQQLCWHCGEGRDAAAKGGVGGGEEGAHSRLLGLWSRSWRRHPVLIQASNRMLFRRVDTEGGATKSQYL